MFSKAERRIGSVLVVASFHWERSQFAAASKDGKCSELNPTMSEMCTHGVCVVTIFMYGTGLGAEWRTAFASPVNGLCAGMINEWNKKKSIRQN